MNKTNTKNLPEIIVNNGKVFIEYDYVKAVLSERDADLDPIALIGSTVGELATWPSENPKTFEAVTQVDVPCSKHLTMPMYELISRLRKLLPKLESLP